MTLRSFQTRNGQFTAFELPATQPQPPALRLSLPRWAGCRAKARSSKVFTLIELLVVIVIIAIVLTIVMAPFDKLTGAAGVNGTTSLIAAQMRGARQKAITQRARVALVFYSNGYDQAMRAAMLYRDNSFEKWVPGTSWTYMLTGGVVEQIYNGEDVTFGAGEDDLLPIWDNAADVDLESLIFKPTGKLGNAANPVVQVSDALWNGTSFVPRGAGKNWQQIEANRFTGRIKVTGP